MKLAVICLGHLGVPDGIARLAHYFGAMQARLFVHIDAKVPLEPYGPVAGLPNVSFVQNRHAVFWGGFSMVRAIVAGIEAAIGHGSYDRFALISEDSVPLTGPGALGERLSGPGEWIVLRNNLPDRVQKRYNQFYYFDSAATNPRGFAAEERGFTAAALDGIARMQALMEEGKAPLASLYHGGMWWALSAQAISVILERHRTARHFRESFEFSAIPDEQYFHTILGEAGLGQPAAPFMHADFDRIPKPYVFRTRAEIEAVRERSKCLFLRKADVGSAEVTEYVRALAQEQG